MSIWYDTHVVLIQGTLVNILLALSIQIPLRMGVFSFAGAGCYGIGAYTTAIMLTRYETNPFLALVVGVLLGAAAGYVLALVVGRLNGLYLAMTTIAFDLILSVIVLNGGSFTGGAEGIFGALTDMPVAVMVLIVVLVLAASAWSERGPVSRSIDAVREDIPLASTMGIDVVRMRRLSMLASGVVGALGGGLNVVVQSVVTPTDLGFTLVTMALTMIVIGGARSWLGAVIGALIITWLPSVLSFVGTWQLVVYGVLVAVLAIWAPGGVVGLGASGWRWYRTRRRLARDRPPVAPAADPSDPSEPDAFRTGQTTGVRP